MRKGIKIKASVLLVSWLIIFAHGITPHNHHEDIPFLHGSHNKACTGETSNIGSHSEDEKGCRISSIIFHKFSQDEQGYTVNFRISRFFIIPSTPVIFSDHYAFLTGRFIDSQSLRAPPSA